MDTNGEKEKVKQSSPDLFITRLKVGWWIPCWFDLTV